MMLIISIIIITHSTDTFPLINIQFIIMFLKFSFCVYNFSGWHNCFGRGGEHAIYECGIDVSQNESFYISI